MKKQNPKKKNATKAMPEKKNLSIINHGDTVVIKNRSTIAAGVLGGLMMLILIIGALSLRSAWNVPMFWVVIFALMLSTAGSVAKMVFGKIVLNSPDKTMTVYNPTKKQYKFEDVNYVDLKTSKGKDGVIIHRVLVYIGNGKRSVEITSTSQSQADELISLLRGMLDNGAMEYPEGNEEPFDFSEEKKEKKGIFGSLFKRKKDTHADNSPEPSCDEGDEPEKKDEKKKTESCSEKNDSGIIEDNEEQRV